MPNDQWPAVTSDGDIRRIAASAPIRPVAVGGAVAVGGDNREGDAAGEPGAAGEGAVGDGSAGDGDAGDGDAAGRGRGGGDAADGDAGDDDAGDRGPAGDGVVPSGLLGAAPGTGTGAADLSATRGVAVGRTVRP